MHNTTFFISSLLLLKIALTIPFVFMVMPIKLVSTQLSLPLSRFLSPSLPPPSLSYWITHTIAFVLTILDWTSRSSGVCKTRTFSFDSNMLNIINFKRVRFIYTHSKQHTDAFVSHSNARIKGTTAKLHHGPTDFSSIPCETYRNIGATRFIKQNPAANTVSSVSHGVWPKDRLSVKSIGIKIYC